MKKLSFLLIALLLIVPKAEAGMLTGMTPSNYTLPGGWSLVRTQNFEGSKPSGETWEIWGARTG
jgi:hypothetical protein